MAEKTTADHDLLSTKHFGLLLTKDSEMDRSTTLQTLAFSASMV